MCAAARLGPKLHVGCGNRPLPMWCNVDVAHLSDDVQYMDALEPMPFPDGTFEVVFSEHFIEHLPYEAGLQFFQEAFRVLKPKGILRTATPDLRFLAHLYMHDYSIFPPADHQHYLEYTHEQFDRDKPRSPVTCVNRAFYGWGHAYLYDAAFLQLTLNRIGFTNFQVFKPGESHCEDLKNLEQHGKSVPPEINAMETFVLEATKP